MLRSETFMYFCANLKVSNFHQSVQIFAMHPTALKQYLKMKVLAPSGNSRPTGLILITFYNGSPCISYVSSLKLCEAHHIKDGVLRKIINMEL